MTTEETSDRGATEGEGGQPSRWGWLRDNAAVRLGVQLAAVAIVGIGLFALADILGTALFGAEKPPKSFRLAAQGVAALSILATSVVVGRKFERRLPAIDVRQGTAEALRGFIAGVVLFSTVVAVVALAGDVTVTAGTAPVTALVFSFGFSMCAAIIEEVVFRGILFRILNESWGTGLAIAATAAFFGGAHGMNENATMMSNVAIALEAGVLLAAVYLLTGRLWMVVGLHAAWNFTQGGVFGLAVSGNEATGWLSTTVVGPTWLSGGAFGLEASVIAVLLCLLVAVAVLVTALKRGMGVPVFWRRARAEREADNIAIPEGPR